MDIMIERGALVQYRTAGRTGIGVSTLVLGAINVGALGALSEPSLRRR